MSGCCEDSETSDLLAEKQRGTLISVLMINAVMFFVILAAALVAMSSALFADSLDNLGDALTYGLSLLVVAGSTSSKARVALFKGCLILFAALFVIYQIGQRIIAGDVPIFELMGIFSFVALIANSVCLVLLWRHRDEDINMSSVWECSRNDIATNLSVLLAAFGVWLADAGWPDIVVASCLVILLLRSATRVVSASWKELQTT